MKMKITTKKAIQTLIDNKTPIFRWTDADGWSVIDTAAYGVSMKTLRKYATYTKTPCEGGEMLTVIGWKE